MTPTTTGAGIYLTGSATTTANFYLGGYAQYTTAGDNHLYFDNGTTEYLMWDDDPGLFTLTDDLEVTGIASST